MIDDLGESEFGGAAGVAAKLFDIAVHTRPVRGYDRITFVGVAFDPVVPTERGHPKAVDENDGGDVHREKPLARTSRLPENSGITWRRKLNAARLLMSSGLC